MTSRAVIVGAGIAGLAAALRLHQIGWEPVVIERAPARRSGGYVVALFGRGYDAAERLGILPVLRERHFGAVDMVYRKPDGRRRFTVPHRTMQALLGDRGLTLMRGEIETALSVAGAELLGTVLRRHPGDVPAALREWEAGLRPEAEERRAAGRRNARAYAPANRLDPVKLDLPLRLANLPPVTHLLRRHLRLH
ncbi:NAD(P)-binding protein [Nonomuraea sp. 3N208]|uniref:NAD(P)-binding protein n=1 Tax=Nonomuraea sp. 3N208 TaxID=3457421 RepID=UPI003FCFDDF6